LVGWSVGESVVGSDVIKLPATAVGQLKTRLAKLSGQGGQNVADRRPVDCLHADRESVSELLLHRQNERFFHALHTQTNRNVQHRRHHFISLQQSVPVKNKKIQLPLGWPTVLHASEGLQM